MKPGRVPEQRLFIPRVDRDGRDLPGEDQSIAQVRTRLSFMRAAPMHHHIDPVEAAFEELPIAVGLERVRHDTRGIREHAILGDSSMTFDALRTGHGNPHLIPT